MVVFLLSLLLSLEWTCCQADLDDFDHTDHGYEFIYHDRQDLLLIMYGDNCYFVSFSDSQEDQLDDTDGHFEWNGQQQEYHVSSLRVTEDSLVHNLWRNRSGDVMTSSLAAVRDKFRDPLADFRCADKHIYEVRQPPSTTQTTPPHHHATTPVTTHPPVTHQTRPDCRHLSPGYHPYPGDCSKFFICSNGQAFVEECGRGTVYNDVYKLCDLPSHVPGCH